MTSKTGLRLFLLFAITSSGCWVNLPAPHGLEYDDKEFNALATQILEQEGVFEMDDFTRYYKSINDVSVKLEDSEGNQDAQFLNIVQDSLKLDSKVIADLRNKLEETELKKFEKSGDSILFIAGGFLGDSWGFMYSKSGLKMDSSIFSFKKKSMHFVEEINKNWKRVAVF